MPKWYQTNERLPIILMLVMGSLLLLAGWNCRRGFEARYEIEEERKTTKKLLEKLKEFETKRAENEQEN